MQKQGLIVLTVVTVAAIGAAGYAVHQRSSVAATATEGAKVFPDLAKRADDVAEIRITDGKDTLTLKRGGDAWTIAERGGFPAKLEKVRETVFALSNLEIEERKTRKKEQYAALGVEEPASEGTSSRRIVLADASGTPIAGAVLSPPKYRSGGSTQMLCVRRDGDDQVYQCESTRAFESPGGEYASAHEWMDTELLRIAQDRVQSVDIVHKDGEEVHVGRSPENHTQFTVENLPPGKELSGPGAASTVGTALSYLSLEDVKPAAEIDWNADPRAQTRYRCTDGLRIDIESARADDKTWIRLAASYDEPPATETPAAETPAAEPSTTPDAAAAPDAAATEPKPAEGDAAAKPDPEKVKKEVEDLNKKFAGWAFEIESYRADALAKRMDDLLKKPEPAPGAEGSMEGAPEDMGAPTDGELPPELKELLEKNAAGASGGPVPAPPTEPPGGG